MYRKFYTLKVQLYALIVYLRVVYVTQNKQRPLQYILLITDFLITEIESVHCAVRTGYLYKADYVSPFKVFNEHTVLL